MGEKMCGTDKTSIMVLRVFNPKTSLTFWVKMDQVFRFPGMVFGVEDELVVSKSLV